MIVQIDSYATDLLAAVFNRFLSKKPICTVASSPPPLSSDIAPTKDDPASIVENIESLGDPYIFKTPVDAYGRPVYPTKQTIELPSGSLSYDQPSLVVEFLLTVVTRASRGLERGAVALTAEVYVRLWLEVRRTSVGPQLVAVFPAVVDDLKSEDRRDILPAKFLDTADNRVAIRQQLRELLKEPISVPLPLDQIRGAVGLDASAKIMNIALQATGLPVDVDDFDTYEPNANSRRSEQNKAIILRTEVAAHNFMSTRSAWDQFFAGNFYQFETPPFTPKPTGSLLDSLSELVKLPELSPGGRRIIIDADVVRNLVNSRVASSFAAQKVTVVSGPTTDWFNDRNAYLTLQTKAKIRQWPSACVCEFEVDLDLSTVIDYGGLGKLLVGTRFNKDIDDSQFSKCCGAPAAEAGAKAGSIALGIVGLAFGGPAGAAIGMAVGAAAGAAVAFGYASIAGAKSGGFSTDPKDVAKDCEVLEKGKVQRCFVKLDTPGLTLVSVGLMPLALSLDFVSDYVAHVVEPARPKFTLGEWSDWDFVNPCGAKPFDGTWVSALWTRYLLRFDRTKLGDTTVAWPPFSLPWTHMELAMPLGLCHIDIVGDPSKVYSLSWRTDGHGFYEVFVDLSTTELGADAFKPVYEAQLRVFTSGGAAFFRLPKPPVLTLEQVAMLNDRLPGIKAACEKSKRTPIAGPRFRSPISDGPLEGPPFGGAGPIPIGSRIGSPASRATPSMLSGGPGLARLLRRS